MVSAEVDLDEHSETIPLLYRQSYSGSTLTDSIQSNRRASRQSIVTDGHTWSKVSEGRGRGSDGWPVPVYTMTYRRGKDSLEGSNRDSPDGTFVFAVSMRYLDSQIKAIYDSDTAPADVRAEVEKCLRAVDVTGKSVERAFRGIDEHVAGLGPVQMRLGVVTRTVEIQQRSDVPKWGVLVYAEDPDGELGESGSSASAASSTLLSSLSTSAPPQSETDVDSVLILPHTEPFTRIREIAKYIQPGNGVLARLARQTRSSQAFKTDDRTNTSPVLERRDSAVDRLTVRGQPPPRRSTA